MRDLTGVSVMQCRKALEEAGGDKDKAIVLLRKKSGDIAAKRTDRTLGAGTIQAYIHATGTTATMVELLCETDFVGKNDDFKKLAYEIGMHITALNPRFVKAEEVTEESLKAAREVFEGEAMDKPADMRAKIVEGKLASYIKEMVLLDQPFVKNPDITVAQHIASSVQKFGEKIEVARFVRFTIGK